MEKELKISIETARNEYQNADDGGRELMERLFGKGAFNPKDITERVKTFDDAQKELGYNHPLNLEYEAMTANQGYTPSSFMVAVMQLSIICAALNEGWKPEFTKDEYRYMPWFWLYTKKEYEEMPSEDKQNCMLVGGAANRGAGCVFASADSSYAPSHTVASIGSALCLRSEALARYCGKQFAEIWGNFLF